MDAFTVCAVAEVLQTLISVHFQKNVPPSALPSKNCSPFSLLISENRETVRNGPQNDGLICISLDSSFLLISETVYYYSESLFLRNSQFYYYLVV